MDRADLGARRGHSEVAIGLEHGLDERLLVPLHCTLVTVLMALPHSFYAGLFVELSQQRGEAANGSHVDREIRRDFGLEVEVGRFSAQQREGPLAVLVEVLESRCS